MRQRVLVGVLVILTALFAWGLGWIAWGFARAGGAVGWGLALAVLVLVALTVWVTWREVAFGMAAARLSRAVGTDVARVDDPRAEFEAAQADAEADDADWRAWYRLGLAYDGLRDRRHARECMRRAIELERAAQAHSVTGAPAAAGPR